MTFRRRPEPPRAPTALGDVLEGTRRAALKRAREAVDRQTWLRAVGRRIAERTEVGTLKAGELIVYVASAPWAQELSLLTPEIRARLADAKVKVDRIRFRVKSSPLSNAKPDATRPSGTASKARLPEELRSRLDSIPDEELRRAISGAAGLAMGRLDADEAPGSGLSTSEAPRAARGLRGVEARSARTDQSPPEAREGSRRSRAKR